MARIVDTLLAFVAFDDVAVFHCLEWFQSPKGADEVFPEDDAATSAFAGYFIADKMLNHLGLPELARMTVADGRAAARAALGV
jgi:hypothetical protein